MSIPALVWFAIGAATTIVLGPVLVALVRQGILVGRTVGRLARDLESVPVPGVDDDAGSASDRR